MSVIPLMSTGGDAGSVSGGGCDEEEEEEKVVSRLSWTLDCCRKLFRLFVF